MKQVFQAGQMTYDTSRPDPGDAKRGHFGCSNPVVRSQISDDQKMNEDKALHRQLAFKISHRMQVYVETAEKNESEIFSR